MSHQLRALAESKNTNFTITDEITSEPLFWWRGNDVRLELALSDNGQFLVSTQVGTINVVIKDVNATSDEAVKMSKTIGSADCDSEFNGSQWASGSRQLCVAEWTKEESALDAGEYVLIVSHDNPAGKRNTYLHTRIHVKEDQHDSTSIAAPPTPPANYYTQSESDARYQPITAEQTFILASNYGVSAANTATVNTAALQAAENAAHVARAVLVLPMGTININDKIDIKPAHDRRWMGRGQETSIINQTSADKHGLSLSGSYNGITLENFGLTGVGAGTATGNGLFLDGDAAALDHTVLRQLRISGFDHGIHGDSISNSLIECCSLNLNNTGFYGEGNSNSLTFNSCAFVSNTVQGVRTQGRGWGIFNSDFGGPNQPLQIEVNGEVQVVGGQHEVYAGSTCIKVPTAAARLTLIGSMFTDFSGGSLTASTVEAHNNAFVTVINVNQYIQTLGAFFSRSGTPVLNGLGGSYYVTDLAGANKKLVGSAIGGSIRDGGYLVQNDQGNPFLGVASGPVLSGKDIAQLAIAAGANNIALGTVANQAVLVAKSGLPLAIATAPDASTIQSVSQQFHDDGSLQLGATARVIPGTGSPEGNVSAPVGSIFLRSDGGASTSFYSKEGGGGGNTGWIAK